MGYLEKIRNSREKSHHSGVASRILTLMDKLREDATQNSARRWVWELLQNAKDVAIEERGVNVEISVLLKDVNPQVEFAHNGHLFSVDNITFLIEQNSTKDRTPKPGETPKTTGKFGTGFLTTHLLSEKVNVIGMVKEPDLPYQQFELVLDRSGRDPATLTKSVENSIELLERLVSQPTPLQIIPDVTKFNTKFKYLLSDEGVTVAGLGLADLHRSIPFVMAFNPTIKFVRLIQEGIIYTLGLTKTLDEGLSLIEVKKLENGSTTTISIVAASSNQSTAALCVTEVNGQFTILPFDTQQPRLFCDFPLIGTHNFPFPVIVNSPLFNPTEPRHGVTFLDKDEAKFIENKKILIEGLECYWKLLTYASSSGWKGLYHIISSALPLESLDWVSRDWYQSEIQKPLREKLICIPLIDHIGLGRVPLQIEEAKSIAIPFHARGEEDHRINVKNQIWDLCSRVDSIIMPPREEIHHWAEVIWAEKYHLGIEALMQKIESCRNLAGLSDLIGEDEPATIDWLNRFFAILSQDQHCLDLLNKDAFAIIPNQNNKFKKKSDLSVDQRIEEELKTVLQMLGHDWRETLVHSKVLTGAEVKYASKDQDMAVSLINTLLKNPQVQNYRKAIFHLIGCFSDDSNLPAKRNQIYQFALDLYPEEVAEKRTINNWSNAIWEQSDPYIIKKIAFKVEILDNIQGLSEILHFTAKEQTLEWLGRFIPFIVLNGYTERLDQPILPNQNGDFKTKDELWLDNGKIDESLKDISAAVGYDCRAEMLDKAIFLELPPSREKKPEMIAGEITRRITPLLAEVPRTDETKKIAKALFTWFYDNPDLAPHIFQDLYATKHRLYDDEQIAENMRKAEQWDALLEAQDITIEELQKLLKKKNLKALLEEGEDEILKPLTNIQDVLIQLGITTPEELSQALKDQAIARRFSHISTASPEMLAIVLGLIERAKQNVQTYLNQHPDYNCTNWNEISKTVIHGVTKRGRPVFLVIRPSDGGQVIFYYSQEKDTLVSPEAELWVADGATNPQHLTLGKILKRNSISRIEV